MSVCTKCSGHGVSFKEVRTEFSSYSFKIVDAVCPVCHGSGTVVDKPSGSRTVKRAKHARLCHV